MYKDFDAGFEGGFDNTADNSSLTLQADGAAVDLPDASYIRDADMTRDGMDLVLDGPQGEITVEGYFAADPAPMLTADDGSALTPELVNSFVQSTPEYAQNMSMTDESPVGAVQEMSGDATVTRTDGSVENVDIGMPIFQGDVIETGSDGAVNISFIDDSSFAVSEDARLAIDEYVFDPSTEAGTQNFSVLKGVFVFTSGLIGRDDPDDVEIDTPMGSIGIRGTIIAGDVNSGEITVVEGAIVLRDFDGNEVTLAAQFDTATFKPGEGIEHNGQKAANDVADKFVSVAKVAPGLFSSINDAAAEALDTQGENEGPDVEEMLDDAGDDADVDGSVDQNADGEVDGSVDDSAAASDGEGDVAEGTVEDTAEGDGEVVTAQTTTNNSLGTDGLGGDDGGLGGQAQTQPPAQAANRFAPTSGSNTSSTQSGSDAAAAGSHNVGDGTTDPGVLNGGDNGPTPIQIQSLELTEVFGTGQGFFYTAEQGGVTYFDNSGTEIHFTNDDTALSGIAHQNLTVLTGAGDDHIFLRNLTSDPMDAGWLHMEQIKTGDGADEIQFLIDPQTSGNEVDVQIDLIDGGAGDDVFKFDFGSASITNPVLNINEINGGDGYDTLVLTSDSNAIIDLRNVDHIKSIEKINMADGEFQNLTLSIEQVLEMAEFDSGMGTNGTYIFKVDMDVGMPDQLTIDTGGEFISDTADSNTGSHEVYNYNGTLPGDFGASGAELQILVTENALPPTG